jgi:hypothetical protein
VLKTTLIADEESEIIAIEIKGKNPKSTWEIIGAYRAPNEDMRAIERLAVGTGDGRSGTTRCIIGGDLNLPNVDWRGNVGGNNLWGLCFHHALASERNLMYIL